MSQLHSFSNNLLPRGVLIHPRLHKKKKISNFFLTVFGFFPLPFIAIIVLIYWELNGISVSILSLLNTL